MKQIIYILGGGRSGSTLLDVILGNNPGIVSCGELRRFVTTSGQIRLRSGDDPCEGIWSRFRDELDKKLGGLNFQQLKRLTRKVEYHTRFLSPATYRYQSPLMQAYGDFVSAFFDVLFGCVEGDVVVDSSKYPGRAMALYRLLDIPVKVIYLVRHPVGVVRSFAKTGIEQPQKGFVAANLYYGVNAMLCSSVYHCIRHDDRIRIRYEDLIQEPAKAVRSIGRAFGLDLFESCNRLESGIPLKVGCLYDGNRIRMQHELILQRRKGIHGWGPGEILTRLLNGMWY